MQQGHVNARIQVHLVLSVWHEDVDPQDLPGGLRTFQISVAELQDLAKQQGLIANIEKGDVIYER